MVTTQVAFSVFDTRINYKFTYRIHKLSLAGTMLYSKYSRSN